MQFLISGCGRVGSGLARMLALLSHQVTVVDQNPASFELLGPDFTGQKFIGISFDREILIKAGVESADGLAAVTSNDEANILTACLARNVYNVPKVIAGIYHPEQAEIYKRLGLQTVAPIHWGIQRIMDVLLYSPLDPVYSIGSGEVELIELDAPRLWFGKKISQVTLPGETKIVAIQRGERTFLPVEGDYLKKGDHLYIAAMMASSIRLREMLDS